ncbi:GGDEF domain-containing protein [Mesorhizobium sp. L-8-3]|uniref:GGDEF domain-containing protein n=1 Tax=Mesorhizobium sp. L-8-3 TaxID=2744522 RepID=UPI0019256CFD|nr:GGDEF domain-containing protein [Mesorhizobium sp. L-8-3]BCH22256.1 GGDEF domain-containing protein [Mesorhizobium sp. L-8-3]
MGKGIFIALLNPAISAIFAGGFFLLWRHQRDRRYIRVLAFSYLAGVTGFLIRGVTPPIGGETAKLISNAFFLVAGHMLAVGVVGRFGRRPPHLALGLVGAAGLSGLSWFLFVEPNMTWRIFSINFALAAMSLIVVAEIRSAPRKIFVDQVLMAALLIYGLSFLVRPLWIIAVAGAPGTEGDVFMSAYWISTSVTHAFFSVLIAICLITGIALDVIGKLQSDALNDPLSGLLNRRGFEERGREVLGRDPAGAMPVTLVLADLDRFKDINDSWGHACGDRVIAAFAGILRDAAGGEGIAGRIGGEEFAIILPGNGLASARLFAEGVRTSLGVIAIPGMPAGTPITASFGVVERAQGDSLSTLLIRADIALYEAKHGGRDRVVAMPDRMGERRLRRME